MAVFDMRSCSTIGIVRNCGGSFQIAPDIINDQYIYFLATFRDKLLYLISIYFMKMVSIRLKLLIKPKIYLNPKTSCVPIFSITTV